MSDLERVERARELAESVIDPGVTGSARIRYLDLVETAILLTTDELSDLDFKIAGSALREMRDAFSMFRPYSGLRKVTIFGSARTKPHDPLYEQTVHLARSLASHGWMVVTGAGPGIMEAGMVGAGREMSIGVSIRLPFETGANPIIAGDEKYVSMRYFFTRKLMLVKESHAFVALPGGFGTLDETFELLTLLQTGKSVPVPVILMNPLGTPYWEHLDRFFREVLYPSGMVSSDDFALYSLTNHGSDAVEEIQRFYSNYDSLRFVGPNLFIRHRQRLSDPSIATLNNEFADIVAEPIIRSDASRQEQAEGDKVELERLRLRFDKRSYGRLREMINRLNQLGEA
ncbi:MAG: TIGR00730 family Rossman fold protein [Actinobacteria bacterium]|nr:TIGR00730 family Rossman fold protein [Actinomycetota bacterium]NDC26343.1 TIGR00730 family Rossman fold protein [Actinomycetota bacterium]NDF41462.1 TIGR00730 family Rossman fold protein [Actinomycetota bacterium]